MKNLSKLVAAVCLVAGASVAQAALMSVQGFRNDTSTALPGPGDAAYDAFVTSFLPNLTVTGTETFSGFANQTPGPLTLSSIGASLSCVAGLGTSCVVSQTGATASGRYNTSPASAGAPRFLTSRNGPDGDFILDFAAGISAFGFYATDIGDFGDAFSVTLTDTTGKTETFALTTQDNNSANNPASGNLRFFGFYETDPNRKYVRVSLANADDTDVFAIDDLVVGRVGTTSTTPEPLSAVLVLSALGLAGAASRRRSR